MAIARRLQLWEERYAEKLRVATAGSTGAEHASERLKILGWVSSHRCRSRGFKFGTLGGITVGGGGFKFGTLGGITVGGGGFNP